MRGACFFTVLFSCAVFLFEIPRQTEAQTQPPTTCSTGWTQHGDFCYIVRGMTDAEAKGWPQAWYNCRNTDGGKRIAGNLVSIGSSSEQNFVYSLLTSTTGAINVASVYIGLNSRLTNGGYRWSDGSAVGYTHWINNFKTARGKDCVAMKTVNGRWTDRECDELTGYICKQPRYGYTQPTDSPPIGAGKYCRSGWIQSNGHCFKYVNSKLTYKNAEAACQAMSPPTHLASIEDIFQQAIVLWMLRQGVDVWIGLDDIQVEGVYRWKSADPVTYSNWGPGEPNSQGRAVDCVDFDSTTGFWNDRWCGQQRGYVCKMHPDQSTSSAPTTSCASGWVASDNHCYWLESGSDSSKKRNYTEAENFCKSQQGHLVHINNQYENAFLAAQFRENGGTNSLRMWIGVNDMAKEGTYVASDMWPIEFTSWRQYEPNDWRHSEDCTEFYAREGDHLVNGLWNDRACSAKLGYICEKQATIIPTVRPPPTQPSSSSCADGWVRWPGQNWCYNFQSALRLSWQDARARCQQYGADLISIHSSEESDFVGTQFRKVNFPTIWMGLNDRNIEGGYVWSDGSPVQFTNWNRGEPNNYYGQEDCVQIYGSKKWNDLACGRTINFGCKISIMKTPSKPASTMAPYYKQPCDANWQSHGPYCYYFSYGVGTPNEKPWHDAQTYCQSHGANLTSITSLDEEEFLSNYIINTINQSDATDRMWIGLSDNVKEGSFQWVDGSDFAYTSWNNGEPNNWGGSEDCGEIVRGQYWNDNVCTKLQPFICKKPRPGVTVKRPSLPKLSIWGTCPAGWMSLMDDPYCYLANKTATSWPQAENYCASLFPNQSSHLASIVTVRESTFITTKVLPHYRMWGGNQNVWIGLNDRQVEHVYVWTDGLPVLLTSWWRYQPNDYAGTQNCVYLNSGQGRWNDLGCQNKRPFLCKMQKFPGSPPPFVALDCSDTYQTCIPKGCSNTTRINCPSGCDSLTTGPGSDVYGYQVYSDDSGICRAAIQSGRVSSKGGNTTIIELPGRSYYSEATFRGVSSKSKGATSTAFTFDFSDLPFKCDPGWISNGYSCYFVVARSPTTSKNWTAAASTCASWGAHLVTISDSYEQTFVQSQVPSAAGNVWIGLTDQSGNYIWSDGLEVGYTHWMRNEPNDYKGKEDCVEMYPSNANEQAGRWNDNKCSTKNGYICEKIGVNESLPYVPPTPMGKSCPDGWVMFNTSCYYVVPDSHSSEQVDLWTWPQARDQCLQMGHHADLLSIHSLAEFQFVRTWLHKADWRRVWVGLNDRSTEGNYVWSDGSPATEAGFYWIPGQPDNWKGNENCVELITATGRLNDRACENQIKLAYACKAPRVYSGGHKGNTGSSGGLSGGAIAGIIIGILLAVAVGVVVFFVWRRRGGGGGAYSLMSKTKFATDSGNDDDDDDVGMLGATEDDDDDAPVDP